MRGGKGIFADAKTGYVVLRIEPSTELPSSLAPAGFQRLSTLTGLSQPLPLGYAPQGGLFTPRKRFAARAFDSSSSEMAMIPRVVLHRQK